MQNYSYGATSYVNEDPSTHIKVTK